MSEMLTLWLFILIASIVVEVISLGLTSIWFAGGALAAAILAALGAPAWLQVLGFLVVTLLLLFFTRPIAVKHFNKKRVRTNVESMVGRKAIVTGEINNLQATGIVSVSGQEWSARSVDEDVIIQPGAVVVVKAIDGVKLMVAEEA